GPLLREPVLGVHLQGRSVAGDRLGDVLASSFSAMLKIHRQIINCAGPLKREATPSEYAQGSFVTSDRLAQHGFSIPPLGVCRPKGDLCHSPLNWKPRLCPHFKCLFATRNS